MTARRPDREAGNAALELAILAPVLIFLIGLIIAAGRISTAENAVDAAAQDAARQASLQLNPGVATTVGEASADAALAQDGLHCNTASVVVNPNGGKGYTAGFTAPVGQPAAVSATVTCTVSLAQIIAPGVPGSKTIQETFTSPRDPFRQR